MATTTINIRIEEATKREMEALCKELGITMSSAFTMFAKKMTREQRIPFEISIDPFYSESNMQVLRQSVEQVKTGKLVENELLDDE